MFLTEGSNFTRMKNKYLTRSLCVTILSAMVLSSPMSVMAADEHIETASDLGDGSGEVISDGSDTPDTPAPEPNTPAPEPNTPAPEPDTPHRSQIRRRQNRIHQHRNQIRRHRSRL